MCSTFTLDTPAQLISVGLRLLLLVYLVISIGGLLLSLLKKRPVKEWLIMLMAGFLVYVLIYLLHILFGFNTLCFNPPIDYNMIPAY